MAVFLNAILRDVTWRRHSLFLAARTRILLSLSSREAHSLTRATSAAFQNRYWTQPNQIPCGCKNPGAPSYWTPVSILDAFSSIYPGVTLSGLQRRTLTSLANSFLVLCDPGGEKSGEAGGPGNKKKSRDERMQPPKRGTDKEASSAGSGPSGGPENEDDSNKNMQSLAVKALMWMLTGYMFIAFLSLVFPNQSQTPENIRYISWNDFVHQMLAKGEVDHVVIHPELNLVTVVLHDGAVVKGKRVDNKVFHLNLPEVADFEARLREAEAKLGINPESQVAVVYDRSSSDFVARLIVALIMMALVATLITSAAAGRGSSGTAASSAKRFGSGLSNFDPFGGLSKAKYTIIDPVRGEGKGVHFADVAGCQEAKQEVMEFVDYLRRPDFYSALGAKVPRGALLLGPPGCGKTMLAKAVATEASVPFLSMNGSEFIEMIGGLGASRVRDLFNDAKKRAPCIIFIDEIDAVGRKRSSGASGFDGGSGEGEQTLNQLLVEMDGMGTVGGVLVLGATNRADILDRALLRPGRFDRHINIDFPTLIEREEIFNVHLKNITLEKSASSYAKRLASLTPGFTGADIAHVVNEGALHAAREKAKFVASHDLEYAIERVVGGMEKKSSAMSHEDRNIVAYHESGHALVGWLLEHTDALLKVTIVPRTQAALGFARYDTIEKKLYSKEELFDKMCMALGGRAAELVMFDRATTGAQDDLKKVTNMAYAQVRKYGLCPVVGPLSFPDPDEDTAMGRFGRRPYSKSLANLIDYESSSLVTRAFLKTQELVTENKDKLELIAEALLKKEVLNYDDIEKLIGPPKFPKKRFIEPVEFEQQLRLEGGGESENGNGNGEPEEERWKGLDENPAPA